MQSAEGETRENRKYVSKDWPVSNALRSNADWVKTGLTVLLVFAMFRVIQSFGWISGIGTQSKELNLGISFLVGVAASLSSCLAVVGGMIIAFSEKYNNGAGDDFFRGALVPNLKFHIGRILTFFVLGGFLGLVGGKINLGSNFISAYTILIAIIMGWLGLNILGLAPSISALGIKTPKFLLRWWGRLEDTEHKSAPYLLGGLTFFLPCGFTQSMQIFALASGSFWAGATSLLFFSLGTVPVLLALGAGASWGKFEKITFVSKAAGIIVILFAIYTLNSGFAILNTNKITNTERIPTNQGTDIATEKNTVVAEKAAQKVEMKITSRGFEPSVLRVKNNIPVQFVVDGDGATGCTNKIVIPDLDVAKDIEKGENIIEFTPQKAGPIAFSCWMGMVRGKIIVE